MFYESDCLGRSPASLIAGRSGPEQSAPVAGGMKRGGVFGAAGQSASASFSSSFELRSDGRMTSTYGLRAPQTTVLSETRHGAGLTLLQVLRRGLELGECLGPTADRANWNYETALRTLVPVPEAVAEGTSPVASRYRR